MINLENYDYITLVKDKSCTHEIIPLILMVSKINILYKYYQ